MVFYEMIPSKFCIVKYLFLSISKYFEYLFPFFPSFAVIFETNLNSNQFKQN